MGFTSEPVRFSHRNVSSLYNPCAGMCTSFPEAVDNFDSILHLSDGIMVARGDLGVELPAEQITNLQKMMVRHVR